MQYEDLLTPCPIYTFMAWCFSIRGTLYV
jgi:hypothetical protein